MRVSKRVLVLGTALAMAAGVGLFGLPTTESKAGESASGQRPDLGSAPVSEKTATVTLVTGDTVTVRKGSRTVTIQRAAGREDVVFHKRGDGKRLYVIPSDAAELVAAGTLDRRLFDVTGLVEQGYDDAGRDDLPLILSYEADADSAATRNELADASVRTTTALSSLNGAAVRMDKSAAAGGWSTLRSAVRDNEVERVWLDGKRKALLDESVPQVGAPQAWDAGFTGKGATVAVLDTGIDAEHPDLADAVSAAKDFSDSPSGTTDKDGHGTHVASTIAGSGKAADGRYAGVAPDAELVVGKVLDDDGYGTDSAIIEGMEWATETKRADVVSMSLGAADQLGQDPMERAVNRLTQETGALFVIAAGNAGPASETIGSPASASRSLAVGAVTKQDKIADFSSRGPTVDGTLKPDVTAPGVNIAAARAQGTDPSDPVGEHYMAASGTSMATPHVAGAAALLAQQHEDWSAPQLKAALVGSAKPNPKLDAYQQGTGRIDVAAAVDQTVIGESGSIDFGTQQWPHDDDKPVEKKLTYRNLGDEPVHLDLAAELNDRRGNPAPDKAIRLSEDTLTVPAGKTASVTITSDTRHDGPDGTYAGKVTATAGEQGVTTLIAAEREVESYDLTINAIGPDGKPTDAEALLGTVAGSRHATHAVSVEDGQATMRLPKADYLFEAGMKQGKNSYLLVRPTVRLNRDMAITADARTAKQASTAVERDGAEIARAEIGYVREGTAGVTYFNTLEGDTFDRMFTAQIGPGEPAEGMNGYVTSQWAKGPFGLRPRNSPYTYTLFDAMPGRFPTGYDRKVADQDLAAVKTTYNTQQRNKDADAAAAHVFLYPDWLPTVTSKDLLYDLPTEATHYMDGGKKLNVEKMLSLNANGRELGRYATLVRTYPVGRTTTERWNSAVFAPLGELALAERTENTIFVYVPPYTDTSGHLSNWYTGKGSMTLTRDGKEIASSEDPALLLAERIPSGNAEFQLRTTTDRSSTSELSTRTRATWTFQSDTAGEDPTILPIWGARFTPKLDRHNVAHVHDGIGKLPVTFTAPKGYEHARIADAKLEVSTDDGETWRAVDLESTGENAYLAKVRTPRGAKHVSVRTTATDANGSQSSIEIIRAYGVSRG